MSNLYAPLQWSPTVSNEDSLSVARAPAGRFLWPTPPYAAYPAAVEQVASEACEITGPNGKVMTGRLTFFVPEEQVAHVQLPPARTTMPLRFDQFRSLTITTPLKPEAVRGSGPRDRMLRDRPRSSWDITWKDGSQASGESIGQVRTEFGLFLFDPLDEDGAVRRVFIPASAFTRFEFGARVGDLLVESQAATVEEVEHAALLQRQMRDQKVGDILVIKQAVTPDQLESALDQQSKMPMVRIGEALLGMGLIKPQHLEAALETQKKDRSVPLGELLVKLGLVSHQDLQTALARKMGYPIVDVRHFPVETDALRKIPSAVAGRLQVLPLMLRNTSLVVAISDPGRRAALEELEFISQCKIVPVLAKDGDLNGVLHSVYARIGADAWGGKRDTAPAESFEFDMVDAGSLVASLEREGEHHAALDEDRPIEQSDNSLVRLINQMIVEACTEGVSDIHIESHPGREKVKIRFRKDGILQPYLELPHNYRSAVLARIKIMCDLDISEKRKPQDGKINFSRFSPQHRIELRVATIPTTNGNEDVVMRLLSSARPLPLDKLGLSPNNLARLKEAVERPYGMVLCVGPTGSGKTTTVHSALSHINVPERKIWTAEDPVEITQPGLRQVQVNPKIDWTFAKALRAFLRADPDVIMVGEMRDAETAHTAIEATLTGHLVVSTLHTNSAPETITRLLDMGMDPFNFADSLLAVLAQRLVRRLCSHCRTARSATPAETEELLADWLQVMPHDDPRFGHDAMLADWSTRFGGASGKLQHYHAAGCKACGGTGYRSRIAIHELMIVTRELRRLIQTGKRVEELQHCALNDGMRTLRQDGIEKVLMGLTTIEEVRATSNV